MTGKATKTTTPDVGGESELRHYTPEEVEELKLLPLRARTLREKAYARELYHHNAGGRAGITFTAEDIRRNAALIAVAPVADKRTKPAA